MNALFKSLLLPPSFIYRQITDYRNSLYDRGVIESYKSTIPVISVGNITVGGNGKTPLCIFLAEMLSSLGRTPVILSRGYGGEEKGPWIVDVTDSPKRVGDEPCLVAKVSKAKVVVSRDRVEGVKLIESKHLGDIVILDDGFQHRRLKRDLDIVSIDIGSDNAIEKLLNGESLPLGPFRESREGGLKRADAIIFTTRRPLKKGEGALSQKISSIIPNGAKVFASKIVSKGVFSLSGEKAISGGRIFAFCGIAKPEAFFDTLKDLGFDIVGKRTFGDHWKFTNRDLERLLSESSGCPLVCTEKDAVKLQFLDMIRDNNLRSKVYKLAIGTIVEPEEAFQGLIQSVL